SLLKTLLFFEQSEKSAVLATLEQYAKHVALVLSFNEGLEQ
ncbi:MAG: hypothetical protein UT95_C0061G0006, partial [Candidatus Curtissbacteria bacterium GW2011_GWB1_40_28]